MQVKGNLSKILIKKFNIRFPLKILKKTIKNYTDNY